MDPVSVGALLGFGGSVISNIWSAREAGRNRQFQERMSSTAMQRQAEDLRKAGINPLLAGRMGGASSPSGDAANIGDVGRGASEGANTGLAIKMQRAQLELLRAQAQQASAGANLSNQQAEDVWTTREPRLRELASRADVSGMTAAQMKEVLPLALERAKAEIDSMVSSAVATRARAALDEAAKTGALNRQEFERLVGSMGPGVRFLLEILNGIRR